jgi:PemK-like, MazF-like toxin of type II toxin-antitoxin system
VGGRAPAREEEGAKERPCVVVLARQVVAGKTLVTVAPVTHAQPSDAQTAVEIPPQIKARLHLDDWASWVIVSEVNDFIWPGPDLRHVPGAQPPRFDFGVLPPGFFRKVRDQLLALHAARRVQPVPRTQ